MAKAEAASRPRSSLSLGRRRPTLGRSPGRRPKKKPGAQRPTVGQSSKLRVLSSGVTQRETLHLLRRPHLQNGLPHS